MSLLFGPRREARTDHPTDSLIELARRRLGVGSAGVPVTEASALTHSAVYECVDLIADLVSTFPVGRFRNVNGDRVPSTAPSVIDNPSTDVDDVNWRRIIMVGWLMRGFTPGLITGMRGAQPSGLELVDASRVTAERRRQDAPVDWFLDGKPMDRWPAGPLWIADGKRLYASDPTGRSVLEFARAEIGMGLAARQFGADWYRDGGQPAGILKANGEPSPDAAKRIKQRFLDARAGNREPIVIGSDWEYEAIQISPNESQFLDSIKANRATVAGFFKVPPTLIGAPAGTGMTYQNVEHEGIHLVRYCVGPWVVRMERVLSALTPRPEYVKLNMDALLRPDAATRWRIHDTSIRAGVHSVNDVRRTEDEPDIGPDGDRRVWPPWRMQLTADELELGADSEEKP